MTPSSLLVKPVGARCNLACDYCFYLDKAALYPNGPAQMPDAVLAQMLESYLSLPFDSFAITFQGGEPLLAPESGTVIFIGKRGDYGLVVEIRHADGFVSRLTHCASVSVELEQHVYRGDPIAVLANDGSQTEPHLHYELLIDGIPFNPLPYIH